MSSGEKVEIKKSRNGQGVFALEDFKNKKIIFEIKGTFLSCDEDDDTDEETRSNTIRFDKEKFLSPEGLLGQYVNHSCVPNSAIIKRAGKLFLKAIKNIKKGEEIVFDYSTIIASDDSWTMKCNCGNKNCRKKIGQFITLPKPLQKKYLALHMVPKYILD